MLLLAAGLAATLSACGKKGALEPPPGEVSRFPRIYPQPTPGAPHTPPPQLPGDAGPETLTLPPSQILPPIPQ